VASIDQGVLDLALARVLFQSVMAGIEVGDPNLAYTVVEAVFSLLVDLLSMNQRGSGSG
jgi:uncharacterized protein (DUF2267 family)